MKNGHFNFKMLGMILLIPLMSIGCSFSDSPEPAPISDLQPQISANDEQENQQEISSNNNNGKLLFQIKRYKSRLLEQENQMKREQKLQQQLLNSLREQLESDKIKIAKLSNRITVRLDERLLFNSGQAFIKASGFKLLNQIGNILKKIENKHIQVEGYTDNLPIGKDLQHKFPTNWELSAARAINVTRYLIDAVKIPPYRLSAAGYSSYQPIASNKTAKGRQMNRRVEFALLPLRINRQAEAKPLDPKQPDQ